MPGGLPALADGALRSTWQRFWTFQFVCLGWVFFNASSFSNAMAVLGRLFTAGGPPPRSSPRCSCSRSSACSRPSSCPRGALERIQRFFSDQRAFVQAGILGLVLLGVTTLGPTGVAPFIYYRF